MRFRDVRRLPPPGPLQLFDGFNPILQIRHLDVCSVAGRVPTSASFSSALFALSLSELGRACIEPVAALDDFIRMSLLPSRRQPRHTHTRTVLGRWCNLGPPTRNPPVSLVCLWGLGGSAPATLFGARAPAARCDSSSFECI